MDYELDPQTKTFGIPASIMQKLKYRGMLCLPGATRPTAFWCCDYDDTERPNGVCLRGVLIDTSNVTTPRRTYYTFMEIYALPIVFFPIEKQQPEGDQGEKEANAVEDAEWVRTYIPAL